MKEFLQNNVTLVGASVVVLTALLWWTGVLEGCSSDTEPVSGASTSVTVPVVAPASPSVDSTNKGIAAPFSGNPAPVPGNAKSSQ